jgi:hypothetical protein
MWEAHRSLDMPLGCREWLLMAWARGKWLCSCEQVAAVDGQNTQAASARNAACAAASEPAAAGRLFVMTVGAGQLAKPLRTTVGGGQQGILCNGWACT